VSIPLRPQCTTDFLLGVVNVLRIITCCVDIVGETGVITKSLILLFVRCTSVCAYLQHCVVLYCKTAVV